MINPYIFSLPNLYIDAIGGTISYNGDYKIHTINIGDSFEVLHQPLGATFELIIQGAGAGGSAFGGGGGGQTKIFSNFPSAVGVYSLSVGGKGIGSALGSYGIGTNGGDTSFDGYTSLGGGTGGGFSNTLMDGTNGGNGGGGGAKLSPTFAGGVGGTGDFNGGLGDPTGNASSGGGGGGSTQNGADATFNNGGKGGDGYLSFIRGNPEYFGCGGGGSGYVNNGIGGSGIGGDGQKYGGVAATDGKFYGAGGGASYVGDSKAGDGYDGVIIISYKYKNDGANRVLLIAGQSNGTDRFSVTGNLSGALTGSQADIYTYFKNVDNASDNGIWQNANTGVNTQTGTPQTNCFSVALCLSARLRDTYNGVSYIIPTAVGGTYLADDENPSWNVNHSAQYYDRAINYHYTPAFTKLNRPYKPILIWIHGENDSDTIAHGTDYETYLIALINKFRADSGFPNAPVIITDIRADYGGPNTGLSYVRASMANVAANLTNVYLFDTSTSRTPLSSDLQHYNPIVNSFGGTLSAINLGEDLADFIVSNGL
jgi:hypothetical protein